MQPLKGVYYSVKLILNSVIRFIEFLTGFALCKMPGDFGLKAIAFCRPCQNFSLAKMRLWSMRRSRHCFDNADNSISAILSQLAFLGV